MSLVLTTAHPLPRALRVAAVRNPLTLHSRDGSTGNYGLQDQRLAVRWATANAAAFGGDASNVVVAGESAGGGSISCHLVAPRSAGLFHAAIVESGPFGSWIARTMEVAETQFQSFVTAAACNATDDVVACLRVG